MLRSATLFGFFGLSLFYLTSYSNGPTGRAGDATGSPLTSTQCSSCHRGGNFDPTTTISLLDQGEAVSTYQPGRTYTLRLSTTAQNSPSGYGFQAVVLDAANNNAGEFGTPPGDFRVATTNSRDYLEHTRVQTESMVEIDWTAPAVGTGEVNVYAAGNAINRNGSTSGDNANSTQITLTEGAVSFSADVNASIDFHVYQTSTSALALELGDQLAFPVQYSVQDLSGRVLQAATANVAEINVAIQTGAPRIVLVMVLDAKGRTGTRRVALR